MKMELTIIFRSANISFDWSNGSNLLLDIRINMESHIVQTNRSIEETMDWSDVDEPMETDEMDGWIKRCKFESNCPLVGPGTIDELFSVGDFLRDPSPYLREFQRKPLRTPNGQVDMRDRDLTWYLPSSSFEHFHSPTSGAR